MNINTFSAGIWIVSGIALCISAYGQEWRLLSGVLLVDFLFFLPSQVYGAELYKDTVYNILTYKKRILEKPKSIKLVFGGVFS